MKGCYYSRAYQSFSDQGLSSFSLHPLHQESWNFFGLLVCTLWIISLSQFSFLLFCFSKIFQAPIHISVLLIIFIGWKGMEENVNAIRLRDLQHEVIIFKILWFHLLDTRIYGA